MNVKIKMYKRELKGIISDYFYEYITYFFVVKWAFLSNWGKREKNCKIILNDRIV